MKTIMVGGELVGVPDDATPELMDKIARNHAQSKRNDASRAEAAALPAPIRAMGGFVHAIAEPAMGLVQGMAALRGRRLPGLEDRASEMRAEREGFGTAGTVGEVGAFAIPGGAGTKFAGKVLPKALSKLAPKLAPAVVAGAVEQGAYEAARPTLEGDSSRLVRGAQGAAWGAGGAAAGSLLPRALAAVGGGMKVAPDAQTLNREFAKAGLRSPLSVGQTLGGGFKSLEDKLAGYPGTGIVPGRERALKKWNTAEMTNAARRAAETAMPEMPDVAKHQWPEAYPAGHIGQARIADDITQLYHGAFKGLPDVTLPEKIGFDKSFSFIDNLAGEQKAQAETVLTSLMRKLQDGLPSSRIKEVESELRETVSKAYQNGQYDLGDALSAIKQDFRTLYMSDMSPTARNYLEAADQMYASTRPMQQAAATQGALTRGAVYTPAQKLSRIRANARPSTLASGRVPGQVQAETANRVLGSSLPDVGPGTAEKVLGSSVTGTLGASALGLISPTVAVGAALPMAVGRTLASPVLARTLTGQNAWQRNPAMQSVIHQLMKKHGVSAEVAAAMAARSGENDAPRQ